MYRNKDTGVSYTMSEIEAIWREHGEESKHETFEDMLNDLEKLDVVYRLTDMDSKHDDEMGGTFETKEEAINAFWRAYADHRRQGTQDDIIRLDVCEYGRAEGEELIDIDFDDKNQGECIIDVWDAYADELKETYAMKDEFEEIVIKALADRKREDLNELGRWFEEFGRDKRQDEKNDGVYFYTGEDENWKEFKLYPIRVPDRENKGEYKVAGYTLDRFYPTMFPNGCIEEE